MAWTTISESFSSGVHTFEKAITAPSGKVITAGGYRIGYQDLSTDTVEIFENGPDWSGGTGIATSWKVSGRANIAGGWSLTVFALLEDEA